MEKALNYIAKICAILSIPAMVFLYTKYINSNLRISNIEQIIRQKPSIEKDSLLRLLEIKEIKEEYYLHQVDVQSNWFTLFVTLLFGSFAIVEIISFKFKTDSISEKYDRQKVENDEHFKEFENKYIKFNGEMRKINANVYSISCDLYMKNKNYLLGMSFAISSIENILLGAKNLNTPFLDISKFVNHKIKLAMECLKDIETEAKKLQPNDKVPTLDVIKNICESMELIISNDFLSDGTAREQIIEMRYRLKKAFNVVEVRSNLIKNL